MRIDASARTVVLICSSCGWRTIATSRGRAWAEGLRHEQRAHDRAEANTANRASANNS